MRPSRLGTYFHTIRHLRPTQVLARVWNRVNWARPDLASAPPRRARVSPLVEPCDGNATYVGANLFRALGVTRRIDSAQAWNDPASEKLWLYNLHYFDDLNAREAATRRGEQDALLRRWIAENPPGAGEGWEPYPVARRIVNVIKWVWSDTRDAVVDHSLAVQTRWLDSHIEFHIGGNHLLADAKALVFAGAFFAGPEGSRWHERGVALVRREIAEQVLADGGHYERSPMYHAAALEDVLDLINVLRAHGLPVPPELVGRSHEMLRWLEAMSHPDGEVSFFNDAAFDIAPTFAELTDYARRLGITATPATAFEALRDSGYVRARSGAAWLAADCAPVGPDYLPGHAHADTLSFEFSLGAQRVLVNSGTSVYGTGAERHRQRGTAAHNCLQIDGADSSEVWAGFRVARRAYPTLHEARSEGARAIISASHDGYRRLPGRNRVSRKWVLDGAELRIDDAVAGRCSTAVAHFHFHPDVRVESVGGSALALRAGTTDLRLEFTGSSDIAVQPGTWHPRFGESVANIRAAVTLASGSLQSRLTWT